MSGLQGKVVIVTGASTGIGAAVAKLLAKNHLKVALAARSKDKLEALERDITTSGGTALSVPTDVTDRSSVQAMLEATKAELGFPDIIVNNAGLSVWEHVKNADFEAWKMQVDVNIHGFLNCVGCILPGMLERGSGHIVNMSSVRGVEAGPGGAVYTGTKHFMEGFSEGLKHEIAGTGIKVTSVRPGLVDTPLISNNVEKPRDKGAVQERQSMITSSGGRVLDPNDVAETVLFVIMQPQHCNIDNVMVKCVNQKQV